MADTASKPEHVVARIHPHLGRLIVPSLTVVVLAVGFGASFSLVTEIWMMWALGAVVLVLAVPLWLVPILAWMTNQMTVTTRRIVITGGILRRSRSEIPYTRIHDVTVKSNPFQRLFGVGDLHLGTGAERDIVMRHVARVRLVQAAVVDLLDSNAGGTQRQRRENARWT